MIDGHMEDITNTVSLDDKERVSMKDANQSIKHIQRHLVSRSSWVNWLNLKMMSFIASKSSHPNIERKLKKNMVWAAIIKTKRPEPIFNID